MKKFIVIFLLICLTAPFLMTFSWLQYRKVQTRKEVKKHLLAEIDKSDLLCLVFSKYETETKLKWEHSREFEFEENMYDIVQTETTTDSIRYWCWCDHKETKLNKQLKDLVAQAMGNDLQQNTTQKRLSDFFKNLYFSDYLKQHNIADVKNQDYLFLVSGYSPICILPDLPPPRCC